jgi:hypothetical protein
MWSPDTLRRAGIITTLAVTLATVATHVAAGPADSDPPPAGPAVVLDAFTATAYEVDRRRGDGQRPVCRLRVAVWEPHRPDAARFPAEVLGETTGLFGDRWLDIRQWHTGAPMLSDRLRLCQEKGFAVVRWDDDWGHPGGLGLTDDDWDEFRIQVAALAAANGLTPG